MDDSPRAHLWRLIAEFRTGSIGAEAFCIRFEETYNLQLDKRSLSKVEREAFAALFEQIVWYSPFAEERLVIPQYLGDDEVERAVEVAHALLRNSTSSAS